MNKSCWWCAQKTYVFCNGAVRVCSAETDYYFEYLANLWDRRRVYEQAHLLDKQIRAMTVGAILIFPAPHYPKKYNRQLEISGVCWQYLCNVFFCSRKACLLSVAQRAQWDFVYKIQYSISRGKSNGKLRRRNLGGGNQIGVPAQIPIICRADEPGPSARCPVRVNGSVQAFQ